MYSSVLVCGFSPDAVYDISSISWCGVVSVIHSNSCQILRC